MSEFRIHKLFNKVFSCQDYTENQRIKQEKDLQV